MYNELSCVHWPVILVQDQVGIVIDSEGRPIGSPLTFPGATQALAAVDRYLIAMCGKGIHVYDVTTSTLVQTLLYPHRPAEAIEERVIVEHDQARQQFLLIGNQKVNSPPRDFQTVL